MFCSGWMMGIGLRFFLMQPTDTYVSSLFDKFFDWGVMFVLGILLLIYAVYDYLKSGRYDKP
jgi:hypothetical protein